MMGWIDCDVTVEKHKNNFLLFIGIPHRHQSMSMLESKNGFHPFSSTTYFLHFIIKSFFFITATVIFSSMPTLKLNPENNFLLLFHPSHLQERKIKTSFQAIPAAAIDEYEKTKWSERKASLRNVEER